MPNNRTTSPWKQFWERGGWWKGVILAAVYYGVYQLGGLAMSPLLRPWLADPHSAAYVMAAFVIPIAFGGLILVLFALSLGWLKELFARQPVRGGRWMWLAVVIVLGFNILRMVNVDYGSAGAGYAAAWLLAGLFIGFAEEVLTRGFVVNLMRKAGHREIAVALVSAAVFSALHAGNLLGGQALLTTLLQLLYTFAFGICMYLTLRVTGNLIWPILLHATTDPSVFLLSMYPGSGPLAPIAALGNFPVILFGLVAIIFIRGQAANKDGLTASTLVAS
ncbi:CPBP family intramembrane glutamic endopeptidase [Arthrobacter sp. GMC3]|uniref:CPBP family intramembrane glutamic endopeptidase n=1 Tax=Arthrobacter sp. GMC3 TaxID=2058894 RepID=UPI0021571FA2|nr:CPBP family intramembrane glutamic endopeptidase [Arthrobacter sp. GMC3]